MNLADLVPQYSAAAMIVSVAPTNANANHAPLAGPQEAVPPEVDPEEVDPDVPELAAEYQRAREKWWGTGGIARWLEEHSHSSSSSPSKNHTVSDGGLPPKKEDDDDAGDLLDDILKQRDVSNEALMKGMEAARRTVESLREERLRRRRRIEEDEASRPSSSSASTVRPSPSPPAPPSPSPPPSSSAPSSQSPASSPKLLLPGAPGTPDPLALSRLASTAKSEALRHLRRSGGDTTNPRFVSALRTLTSIYRGTGNDARKMIGRGGAANADIGWTGDAGMGRGAAAAAGMDARPTIDGDWTILSKPSFPGCLGTNSRGEYMYGLGRMSFDMFRPTNLRCSIRNVRTEVGEVDVREDLPARVPKGLREEIERFEKEGESGSDGEGGDGGKGTRAVLRTYNIVINFTIEPRDSISSTSLCGDGPDGPADPTAPAPSCPLLASMTNEGYMLSDPDTPNRLTVWFTGGELGPRSREAGARSNSAMVGEQRRPRRSKGDLSSAAVAEQQRQPGAAGTTSSSAAAEGSPGQCPHVLHECRRHSKFCLLHGVGTRRKPVGLPSNASLQWEDIFGQDENWKRTWSEKAKALAAKVILGAEVPRKMEEDGTMRYRLHRPVGGHGSTYVDVLYLDRDLSITRGNANTIFVQARTSSVNASAANAVAAACRPKGTPKTTATSGAPASSGGAARLAPKSSVRRPARSAAANGRGRRNGTGRASAGAAGGAAVRKAAAA